MCVCCWNRSYNSFFNRGEMRLCCCRTNRPVCVRGEMRTMMWSPPAKIMEYRFFSPPLRLFLHTLKNSNYTTAFIALINAFFHRLHKVFVPVRKGDERLERTQHHSQSYTRSFCCFRHRTKNFIRFTALFNSLFFNQEFSYSFFCHKVWHTVSFLTCYR